MCIHVGYIIYTYMNHQEIRSESSTDLDGDHWIAIEEIQ